MLMWIGTMIPCQQTVWLIGYVQEAQARVTQNMPIKPALNMVTKTLQFSIMDALSTAYIARIGTSGRGLARGIEC